MNEVKLKIIDLVRSKAAFEIVFNLPLISQASRFRLKTIAKLIYPLIDNYTETAEAIKYDFCVEGPENQLIVPFKKQPLMNAQVKELNAQEVTLDVKKFKLFDLRIKATKDDPNGLNWATGALLFDLDWLIEEEPIQEPEQETTEE